LNGILLENGQFDDSTIAFPDVPAVRGPNDVTISLPGGASATERIVRVERIELRLEYAGGTAHNPGQ